MAGGASTCNLLVSCKKCKAKVTTGIKCKNCGNYFHLSCAKLVKSVKFISENEITCCDDLNADDKDFNEALILIADENGKVDIRIINYILKQKDIIISELRNQIDSLKYQLDHKLTKLKCNEGLHTLQSTNGSPVNCADNMEHFKQDNSLTDINPLNNKQIELSTNSKIDSNNEHKKNMVATNDNSENEVKDSLWTTVVSKKSNRRPRQNHIIVGDKVNNVSSIKAIKKKAHLFVSRLEPDTKPEAVTNLLKQEFPEVECEPITTKYPNLYASFKITINFDNFSKAMEPNKWPEGTLVTRFFHRKKTQEQTK
ncbi:hypothetical protein RI129_006426 [Pyrocoelia pectoralis]|uniref:Zinc finger PHD-type domain-containing protein n=1 Tax=Pyrocoelia pectoralis TaxID=417401 RepID=A0AAN7ZPK0_9COLE